MNAAASKRTWGARKERTIQELDTKRYRIWFCSYSCKLGLVEKSFVDYNETAFKSINQNKTVEQINKIINKISYDDE